MQPPAHVTEIDPAVARDAEVAATGWRAACTAAMPGRPASSLETQRNWLRVPHHLERSRHWLALGGGAPVGVASLDLDELPGGRDQAWARLAVTGGERGRGVGRLLLATLAGAAAAEGRREFGLTGARAGVGFADALGLRRATEEIISDLDLAGAPWGRIAEWAAGAGRGPEYRTRGWRGGCPPDLIAGYAAAKHVMNTAPSDDLNVPELPYDAAWIAAQDDYRARVYAAFTTHVAIASDGAIAGFTELCVPAAPSAVAYVEDTAVLPGHRGQGLARRLKAAALLELRASWPHITAVRTWNAASNGPILRINRGFGFRPVLRMMTHQDPTAVVLARAAG